MSDLFFYGTLCHMPLLETVLGKPAADINTIPAELPDHAVFWAAEGAFPVIVAQVGSTAPGIILRDLSDEDVARLDFYEGGYDYVLAVKTLADGTPADVYFPQAGAATPTHAWSLSDWVRDWGEMTCLAAIEAMTFSKTRTAKQIARMFPMIRARAAATLNAKHSKHGAGTLDGRVDIISKTRVYTDFFAVDRYDVTHELFDGGTSAELDRAIFLSGDAAIVLPYDPVLDRVLVVEQFRMGPVGRGDPHAWQIEPIAGRIDAGETGVQAALREAKEEADLDISVLEPVAELYPSPGTSTEFYYLYVGLADLPDDIAGLNGLATEHEDIRTQVLTLDALLDMVDNMQVANAPLVLLTYWVARHRERLRALS